MEIENILDPNIHKKLSITKKHDILFYNKPSPRSQKVFEKLKNVLIFSDNSTPEERVKAISESFITIYIRPEDISPFNIECVCECLGSGSFLISEKFNWYPKDKLKDGRDFVSGYIDEIPTLVDYYLNHKDQIKRIADSGYKNLWKNFKPKERPPETSVESHFLKNRNYFFITGSQRSGTTLLELMLDSHPEITVFGEPWVYDRLNNKDNHPLNMTLGFKIPMWAHRWQYFEKNFPNAKILFMHRNIKSIVASMLNLSDYDGTGWVKTEMTKEIDNTLPNISNPNISRILNKHYEEWKKDRDPIRGAVICAYAKQKLLDDYNKSSLTVFRVSYEELVTEPNKITRDICRFIGLKWDEQILRHHDFHKGKYMGATLGERPIDMNSLGKWKRILSPEQSSYIDNYTSQLDQEVL